MGFWDNERFYPVMVDGKPTRFPSCSTIAKVPQSQALLWWAAGGAADAALEPEMIARLAEYVRLDQNPTMRELLWKELRKAPFAYRQKRADEGTAVHAVIEAWTKGEKVDLAKIEAEARPYAKTALDWLDTNKPEVIVAEQPVVDLERGYAGRLDAIWRLNGAEYLMDVKTRKPDGKPGPWVSEALQIAGYRFARANLRRDGDNYVFDGPAKFAAESAILAVWPDRAELVPVEAGEAELKAFLAARDLYLWMRKFEGKDE